MGSQPSPFPCTTPLTIVCPYWRPDCCQWWKTLLPTEICTRSNPSPFKNHNFDQYPHTVPQPWELAKKVQLVLIGSRSCHRRTMYVTSKSPKGSHENAILLFLPVKFNFCRNKSATKFLCVKTSISTVVATAFLYLTVHRWIATVHRWIAGDDPST